jgi:hypothetical protein
VIASGKVAALTLLDFEGTEKLVLRGKKIKDDRSTRDER